MADSLHYMPQGMYMRERYGAILHPTPDIDVDATIEHVASAGGLEVIE